MPTTATLFGTGPLVSTASQAIRARPRKRHLHDGIFHLSKWPLHVEHGPVRKVNLALLAVELEHCESDGSAARNLNLASGP